MTTARPIQMKRNPNKGEMANRFIGSYESRKMRIFGSAVDRGPRIFESDVPKFFA